MQNIPWSDIWTRINSAVQSRLHEGHTITILTIYSLSFALAPLLLNCNFILLILFKQKLGSLLFCLLSVKVSLLLWADLFLCQTFSLNYFELNKSSAIFSPVAIIVQILTCLLHVFFFILSTMYIVHVIDNFSFVNVLWQ